MYPRRPAGDVWCSRPDGGPHHGRATAMGPPHPVAPLQTSTRRCSLTWGGGPADRGPLRRIAISRGAIASPRVEVLLPNAAHAISFVGNAMPTVGIAIPGVTISIDWLGDAIRSDGNVIPRLEVRAPSRAIAILTVGIAIIAIPREEIAIPSGGIRMARREIAIARVEIGIVQLDLRFSSHAPRIVRDGIGVARDTLWSISDRLRSTSDTPGPIRRAIDPTHQVPVRASRGRCMPTRGIHWHRTTVRIVALGSWATARFVR